MSWDVSELWKLPQLRLMKSHYTLFSFCLHFKQVCSAGPRLQAQDLSLPCHFYLPVTCRHSIKLRAALGAVCCFFPSLRPTQHKGSLLPQVPLAAALTQIKSPSNSGQVTPRLQWCGGESGLGCQDSAAAHKSRGETGIPETPAQLWPHSGSRTKTLLRQFPYQTCHSSKLPLALGRERGKQYCKDALDKICNWKF